MEEKRKSHILYLDKVKFQTLKDGFSVRMMYVGLYDDELRTFVVIEKFCNDNNFKIKLRLTEGYIYQISERQKLVN